MTRYEDAQRDRRRRHRREFWATTRGILFGFPPGHRDHEPNPIMRYYLQVAVLIAIVLGLWDVWRGR